MEAYIWISLLFGLIWGLVCSSMARNKGREATWGFLGGFIFGLFAVIYYACVSETMEHQAQKMIELESLIDKKRKK